MASETFFDFKVSDTLIKGFYFFEPVRATHIFFAFVTIDLIGF